MKRFIYAFLTNHYFWLSDLFQEQVEKNHIKAMFWFKKYLKEKKRINNE